MTKLIDVRTIAALVLVSFLCGCSNTAGSGSKSQTIALQQADKFSKMAGKGTSDSAVHYRMRAAEQLVIADQPEQALAILNQNFQPKNKPAKLSSDNAAYKQIILAQIALSKSDPEAALRDLRVIWTPSKLPEYLKIKFYSTRSAVYKSSNRNVEAVQERLFLAKHINNHEELKANNEAIWEILSESSPATLNNLQASNSSNELKGWVAFAKITKEYDHDSRQLHSALTAWQTEYPQHPAISFMPDNLLPAEQSSNYAANIPSASSYSGKQLSVPHKIALILPLQGANAQAALAVRDGFMAAYNSQTDSQQKPKIQVFDTTAHNDVQDIYREAVNDGADFIVGPLIKEEVESLSSSFSLRVPVLALNILPKQRAKDNVFQFGLSPEMEAYAVADKAWRDGRRNALIIAPKSAWGTRMFTAFKERWEELGGNILASQSIQSQANLNKEVQQLLAIDTSEARAKELKQAGLKFTYEARRRQDADMIFIATNAALARQVKPLLNFYYAAKIPAYASSSVFSGTPQPSLDQDLNGIQFCDMPWVLDGSVRNGTNSAEAQGFEQYNRLFALGLDSYKIAMHIDQLTLVPDLGLPGKTGKLTMDSQQHVQRKLLWAKFKNGLPVIERE